MARESNRRKSDRGSRGAGRRTDELERRARDEVKVRLAWAITWRYVGVALALALVVAAGYLPATALAGVTTEIDISIAVAVSLSLVGLEALTALWGGSHKRRHERVDRRNRKLELQVVSLQSRLRENGLPDDVPE